MKNIDFLEKNLIAHRGMHDINRGIPENSIEAFKRAINNNFIIELDLHILKDKNVVVFHDDDLNRMTGKDKKIADCTYEEIKNLKLQNTDNYIPLFNEVLKVIDGKVPIIIELKYDTKCGILEKATMELLANYKGLYAIKSFNPFSVNWLRKNYPNVIRGQLSSDFRNQKMNIIKKLFLKSMIFNVISMPDFISYDIRAMPNKKIEKERRTKKILGWTVSDTKTMLEKKKYCDNLICEKLDELC